MSIYGIPIAIFWVVGIISVVLGLASILFPDRMVRGMPAMMLKQLRWLRSARYRQWLKINGWLLFVLGILVLILLTILVTARPT